MVLPWFCFLDCFLFPPPFCLRVKVRNHFSGLHAKASVSCPCPVVLLMLFRLIWCSFPPRSLQGEESFVTADDLLPLRNWKTLVCGDILLVLLQCMHMVGGIERLSSRLKDSPVTCLHSQLVASSSSPLVHAPGFDFVSCCFWVVVLFFAFTEVMAWLQSPLPENNGFTQSPSS